MTKPKGIDEARITEIIRRHYPGTQAIYLFGSYATGDVWPMSDVDLAVLLPPDDAKSVGSLALSDAGNELSLAVQKEIDFVNLRQASTVFQHEVIHKSRLLIAVDEEAILAYEMGVLSAYQKLNEERSEILEEFFKTKRAYAL